MKKNLPKLDTKLKIVNKIILFLMILIPFNIINYIVIFTILTICFSFEIYIYFKNKYIIELFNKNFLVYKTILIKYYIIIFELIAMAYITFDNNYIDISLVYLFVLSFIVEIFIFKSRRMHTFLKYYFIGVYFLIILPPIMNIILYYHLIFTLFIFIYILIMTVVAVFYLKRLSLRMKKVNSEEKGKYIEYIKYLTLILSINLLMLIPSYRLDSMYQVPIWKFILIPYVLIILLIVNKKIIKNNTIRIYSTGFTLFIAFLIIPFESFYKDYILINIITIYLLIYLNYKYLKTNAKEDYDI